MRRSAHIITARSAVLATIFLLNSLVLYIPSIYRIFHGYYNYIAMFSIVVLSISINRFRIEKGIAAAILLTIIAGFISIQFNGLPIGEFFPLLWFLIILYCCCQLSIGEIKNPILNTINAIFWAYLVIYSFAFHTMFVKMFNSEVVEGILNPNMVGIGIVVYALLWEVTTKTNTAVKTAIVYVISLLGVYMSNARVALLAFIVTIIIRQLILHNHLKHSAFAVISIIVTGFLFTLLVIFLWRQSGGESAFLGKSLFTGRERIWSTLYSYMEKHPSTYITGTGKNEILFWHDNFNLHNAYLSIYAEYGIVTTIAFWGMLAFIIIKRCSTIYIIGRRKKTSRVDVDAVSLAIFSLLVAYTETNYTYILSIAYIAIAYGILARVDTYDT